MQKKEIVNLIIALIVLIGGIVTVAYFLAKSHNKRLMEEESKIQVEIKQYLHRIDSLKSIINALERSFYQDSVDYAQEQLNSQKAIKSLQKRLYETSFKHYNNTQLDSVVHVLFPRARLYSPTGNGTVNN